MDETIKTARLMAGIPAHNNSLFHRVQFNVGDPAAWIEIDGRTTMLLRDIEVHRAREHALDAAGLRRLPCWRRTLDLLTPSPQRHPRMR